MRLCQYDLFFSTFVMTTWITLCSKYISWMSCYWRMCRWRKDSRLKWKIGEQCLHSSRVRYVHLQGNKVMNLSPLSYGSNNTTFIWKHYSYFQKIVNAFINLLGQASSDTYESIILTITVYINVVRSLRRHHVSLHSWSM